MHWGRYILRRLGSALAVLLAVILLTFWLSRYASDDPVYAYLATTNDLEQAQGAEDQRAYRRAAQTLGQDLPPFFFSLRPSHYPDTLHLLMPLTRKLQAQMLLKHGFEWSAIERFQSSLWNEQGEIAKTLQRALTPRAFQEIQHNYEHKPKLDFSLHGKVSSWPSLHWNGFHNSFWHFAGGMLKGDFGYSLQTGEAVSTRIARAFRTTLPIATLALILSLVLGTWLGTLLAKRNAAWLKRLCYVLLSLPGFWIVSFAMTQLSGRGKPFPGPGWMLDGSLGDWIAHAGLPILIMGIPAAAYLALVMEESLQQADRVPIRDFARLRGQSENRVWFGDMYRLGLVPGVVTIVGLLIPSFIGGSVVVEYVFNIPGLGRMVFESILARDWPVVLAVVVLSSFATIFGYILIDVVNAWLDPRFRKLTSHVA